MPVVLQLIDAHKRYGDQALLDGASCAGRRPEGRPHRPQRGGKSTLCRILLGRGRARRGRSRPQPATAARLPAAARSVSCRRNGPRVSDARQRPARLAVRRSGLAVSIPGRRARPAGPRALRRLADAGQAGGPAAARSEPADPRRADELSRPADADSAGAISCANFAAAA